MKLYRICHISAIAFVAAFVAFVAGDAMWGGPKAAKATSGDVYSPVKSEVKAVLLPPAASVEPAASVSDKPLLSSVDEVGYEPASAGAGSGTTYFVSGSPNSSDIYESYVSVDAASAMMSSGAPSSSSGSGTSGGSGSASSSGSSGSSSGGSGGGASGGGGSGGSGSSAGGGGSAGGSTVPEGDSNGGAAGAFSNIKVTVISGMERLLRDDSSAPGQASAEVFCAKNETESFQIIVTNQSYYSLPDVDIHVSEWQGGSGAKKPILTLFREHYVRINKTSYGLPADTPKGWYPDALIPFVNPYSNEPITTGTYLAAGASVGSRENQGYWADVRVDSEVPAGTYTCSILITSRNSKVAEIPVALTVWDFTLPVQPAWTAWFCNLRGDIHKPYGIRTDTNAYNTLWDRHEELLYQHGIYPSFRLSPAIDSNTGEVTFSKYYIDSLRDFIRKYGQRVMYIRPLFIKEPIKLIQYISSYQSFSSANDWAGQFFYYIDEPPSSEEYQNIKQCGEIINEHGPSIKLLVTFNKIAPASWPDLEDVVGINVLLSSLSTKTRVDAIKNRNKEAWVYYALTRDGLNWQIDSSLMDYRVPAWCSFSLGIEGILYWHTTLWAQPGVNSPVFDPWLISESFNQPAYDGSGKKIYYNGEGFLIYPGASAGIFGPVASMRLKAFRDSVEDYSCLKLLEAKIGREQTVTMLSPLVTDFLNYDSNPEHYLSLRRNAAELILR